jgi:hypothetical protein
LLKLCLKDEDCSVEFGGLGGHFKLLSLLESSNEEIQEIAGDCIALSVQSGVSFPMAKSPLPFRRNILLFKLGGASPWSKEKVPLEVRIRKKNVRQIGNMMWGSSILLSEYLYANSHLFEGLFQFEKCNY